MKKKIAILDANHPVTLLQKASLFCFLAKSDRFSRCQPTFLSFFLSFFLTQSGRSLYEERGHVFVHEGK